MSVWWPLQDGEVFVEAGKPAEHWVLRMTAEFSSVQLGIEVMLGHYLRRKSPALAGKIAKKHLQRLSDDDRWDYLKALSADAGYTGHLLPRASDAFWRCKRVRDLVGHHPGGIELVRSHEHPEYHYHLPRDGKNGQIPDPLTPTTFRQLGAECRWLNALIDHIGFLAGQSFISAGVDVDEQGQARYRYLEVLEPPVLPIPPNWTADGLTRPMAAPPDQSVTSTSVV